MGSAPGTQIAHDECVLTSIGKVYQNLQSMGFFLIISIQMNTVGLRNIRRWIRSSCNEKQVYTLSAFPSSCSFSFMGEGLCGVCGSDHMPLPDVWRSACSLLAFCVSRCKLLSVLRGPTTVRGSVIMVLSSRLPDSAWLSLSCSTSCGVWLSAQCDSAFDCPGNIQSPVYSILSRRHPKTSYRNDGVQIFIFINKV